MDANSAPDTTQPASDQPGVVGIVTIEAPPYKEGTSDTNKPQLDLEAKSIRDTDQAWELCKGTESANKARSMRSTIMELEYTGQPPYSEGGAIAKGQSWQSNVCTGVLAGVTDRKVLRFVKKITDKIYLTRSSLPTTWNDWKKKSDLFCIHTTRFIQAWKQYSTFLNMLAKEDVLHGYGFGIFLDPYTPYPKFFKQEICYVPDESPQNAAELQFIVLKHDYLLHEFIDLFRDEEAAKDIGYDIENCVKAAHDSTVKNPREDATTTEFRKFAEFISDGVVGITYATSGARVVKTYILINREYDGKVSFWLIRRDDGKQLRFAYKMYKSFEDAACLFSFQPGNGHLHSSKGLGRMLIGNVKMAEKNRNSWADNVRISGLKILKAPTKDRAKLQPIVSAPFVVIDSSIEVEQQIFNADLNLHDIFDQRVNGFMEQSAGVWISSDLGGKQPDTATEANLDAQKDQDNADMTEARWDDQLSALWQAMQRRIYSNDNLDEGKRLFDKIAAGEPETEEFYDGKFAEPEVLRVIVDILKEGLTIDEIKVLRSAPTSGYAHTDDAITASGILALMKDGANNKNIDQVELTKRWVEALAGPDSAKALCLIQPDQTLQSEAVRMQMGEIATMQTLLQEVPNSPRDNDLLHGAVCQQFLTVYGGVIQKTTQPNDPIMHIATLVLNHLGAHLSNYLGTGGVSQDPNFRVLNDFYKQFEDSLEKAVSIQAHAAQAQKISDPKQRAAFLQQSVKRITHPASRKGPSPMNTIASGQSPVSQTAPEPGQTPTSVEPEPGPASPTEPSTTAAP